MRLDDEKSSGKVVGIDNFTATFIYMETRQITYVDWYIKADDIVLKNKNGQPAEILQTKRKVGSVGLIDRARVWVVSCQYDPETGRFVSADDVER